MYGSEKCCLFNTDCSIPDASSYVLIKTKLSWFDAAEACRRYGANAHLAFTECETENEFILNFIKQELRDVNCEINTNFCNVWIGLNDIQEEGKLINARWKVI